jgi:hypothetical protein
MAAWRSIRRPNRHTRSMVASSAQCTSSNTKTLGRPTPSASITQRNTSVTLPGPPFARSNSRRDVHQRPQRVRSAQRIAATDQNISYRTGPAGEPAQHGRFPDAGFTTKKNEPALPARSQC